jgi:3-oxoadipate enol-lactonase
MKINANGISVNCELSGSASAATVMLSHSLATQLGMWAPQLAALEPRYRVLRYDTRGHGGSDAPAHSYSLEQLAEDAMALLDALGIHAVHWVGISMGGMIGQAVALNHPDRLLSLVLCDTAAAMSEDAQPVWQQRIDTAGRRGMAVLVEETLQRWFTPAFLAQDPPVVRQIREMIRSTPVEGFVGCSQAIRRLNYLERLSRITVPTLIVVGEDDPGTPVAASEAIHARIPQSRLQVIPSAAHLCNIEQASAFNTALLEFLRRQPQR